MANVTADINKLKPRTAHLLVSAAKKNYLKNIDFLLECDAAYLGIWIPIFQSNVLPSF
jgi:hypothetical protein